MVKQQKKQVINNKRYTCDRCKKQCAQINMLPEFEGIKLCTTCCDEYFATEEKGEKWQAKLT